MIEEKILKQIVSLSDGNPGAATVLGEMAQGGPNIRPYFDWMEKSNLSGPLIWVAYKDMFNFKIIELLVWLSIEMERTNRKYEIHQYEGICRRCKKDTYITAIVKKFDYYICFGCREKQAKAGK